MVDTAKPEAVAEAATEAKPEAGPNPDAEPLVAGAGAAPAQPSTEPSVPEQWDMMPSTLEGSEAMRRSPTPGAAAAAAQVPAQEEAAGGVEGGGDGPPDMAQPAGSTLSLPNSSDSDINSGSSQEEPHSPANHGESEAPPVNSVA